MIFVRSTAALFALVLVLAANANDPSQEWPYYGQDPGGARYSSLDQINTSNANTLERAWTFRTGDIGPGKTHYAECTPLVVHCVMYVITPFSRLIAIDAETGEERWRFSPDPPLEMTETTGGGLASRGVTYWSSGEKERIFLPVRDGRIYAIDIDTHLPDPAFADQGCLNLRDGLPDGGKFFFLSSPPAICKDVLLQPYGIDDTSARLLHYVPLRAFDARKGKPLWTFDTVPQPGQFGHETWGGESWKNRSGCNPWSPISADLERGIFYIAVGAPNSDKFGGDRPGDNLFANSIVALNALSGERVWHFQAVHHDLWDYDLPAMPCLFELKREKESVPAVAVVGKTGLTYLFNRVTGEHLFPIEERPVPASDVPGEAASPTQPFPVKPPAFARNRMTRDDLHATDPQSLEKLQAHFDKLRSEGPFTPPSEHGSVVIPGQLGGANWSGAAISPDGMLYVNATELPYITKITPSDGPFGYTPSARHFLDASGNPAIKPPWGTITKIDLTKGELVWQRPLGDFPESKLGKEPTGQMNFGGGTITAGGLYITAAALDAKLRIFNAASGDVLAEYPLEVAGQGAPVTWLGQDGKQYVAIFAGGGGKSGSPSGDYVVAFRLRR